jgi:dihydrofolate synthase/folylpolyglutamate synthase
MNYPESVDFLYAPANEFRTAGFGLDGIRKLLEFLKHPERRFKFIHLAGTNGKGSTSAMIEAGLRAAGKRTGLYTSPHLVRPTERIQVGGRPISAEQFATAFERVHGAAETLLASGTLEEHPSYFETMTAMAFVAFEELGAETVVVEVGLGGTDDATNVIAPELCVITPIDFDHERFLGNTIAAISEKKAGILKPGVPAIFAKQRAEAERVLIARAEQLGCAYRRAATEHISNIKVDARGSCFTIHGHDVVCPLAGEHQLDNAITAALALEQLGVPPEGMVQTLWPGRLERVAESPEIILDGAHNPAGARALASYIQRFYAGRRIWMVYGSMRDKAVEEVTGMLFPLANEIVATAPRFGRALRPDAIRSMYPDSNVRAADTVAQAVEIVGNEARPSDAVFITGSLFVVGEARGLLVQ